MNVLALCLVYASLVTAGFLIPSPEKHKSKDDGVTVKGGVVIEFEKDDGNTKVSVSPQDSHEVDPHSHIVDDKGYVANAKEKLEEAKERLKEASSSVLPEVMKKVDSAHQQEDIHHRFRPGEVVCDANGKCKDKIESYVGRTKVAAEKKAHEAANKVYEVEEEAKEAVREAIGKVEDTVAHTAHRASDKAHEMKENVKDAASEVSSKTKDKVGEKASEMKEGAKEKAREKAKEAEELVDRAKHGATQAKKEGKRRLSGILRRAGAVLAYMVSPMRMASSFTGVLHLLGFAVAYGMCVWVTFASNYVLAGALPRHQFAMVQSQIYPVYFKAMACSVGMALLGHMMGQRKRFSPLSMGNLMASLVMILVNLLYLEPRATKVRKSYTALRH